MFTLVKPPRDKFGASPPPSPTSVHSGTTAPYRLEVYNVAASLVTTVMTSLPSAKDVLNVTHGKLVFSRRVRELSAILATTLPKDAKVLDVGAGDGSIASNIMKQRADLSIEGVDVFQRPTTQIPVAVFDGRHLPFADSSFDCVLFVDVLHHTDDASELVREAARVANNSVVIKDHLLEGMFAGPTLRFMDWVGNRGHDVVLPYNYLPRSRWDQIFSWAGLRVASWRGELGLYPDPASWLFDRQLHFVARLTKR
jgi:SAM-dependent methyltransferase